MFGDKEAKKAGAVSEMSDQLALMRLLVAKGVMTWDEFMAEKARAAEVAVLVMNKTEEMLERVHAGMDMDVLMKLNDELMAPMRAYVEDGQVPS